MAAARLLTSSETSSRAAGLGHVATLSFLGARAAPPIGFPLSLAGGVALCRAGERLSIRSGYGVGLAALVETVAISGPARMGGPISQALTAPLIGALLAEGGGRRAAAVGASTIIRFAYTSLTTAFFIFVIAGGLDPYAGTYEAVLGWLGFLPEGVSGALLVTGVALLGWALIASLIQVAVYLRARREWAPASREAGATGGSTEPDPDPGAAESEGAPGATNARIPIDPRAAAAATAIGFALLVAFPEWPLLAAVAAWLGAVWVIARPAPDVLPSGLTLMALLAALAFAISLLGGDELAVAAARGVRAALLVLVATWFRGVVGVTGFREVVRRSLRRLRRLPAAVETERVLEQLATERRLLEAVRALIGAVKPTRLRPLETLDAILGWIAAESSRFRPSAPGGALALRLGLADLALAASALLPLAALAL